MVLALCILFLIVGVLSALCYLLWRQVRALTVTVRSIRPLSPEEFHQLVRSSTEAAAARLGMH